MSRHEKIAYFNKRQQVDLPQSEKHTCGKYEVNGTVYPLTLGLNWIGSASHCQVRIQQEGISSLHCLMEISHGICFVEDLCSTNGTMIEDMLLVDKRMYQLKSGDTLVIGPVKGVVTLDSLDLVDAGPPMVPDSPEIASVIAPARTASPAVAPTIAPEMLHETSASTDASHAANSSRLSHSSHGEDVDVDLPVAKQPRKVKPIATKSSRESSKELSGDPSVEPSPEMAPEAVTIKPRKRTVSKSEKENNDSSKKLKESPKILFTGIDEDDPHRQIVDFLGGVVTQDWRECTHLVTDKMRRTAKFLCCLSAGKWIVSLKWLAQSKKSGKFMDEQKHILKDAKFEKQWGFSLAKSMALAPVEDLFHGKSVYATPSVLPPSQDLKEILEASNTTLVHYLTR